VQSRSAVPLKDAEIRVYSASSNVAVASGMTDEDGKIKFELTQYTNNGGVINDKSAYYATVIKKGNKPQVRRISLTGNLNEVFTLF
jgi:hypothetical protein